MLNFSKQRSKGYPMYVEQGSMSKINLLKSEFNSKSKKQYKLLSK